MRVHDPEEGAVRVRDDNVAERRACGQRVEILANDLSDISAETELQFERRDTAGNQLAGLRLQLRLGYFCE